MWRWSAGYPIHIPICVCIWSKKITLVVVLPVELTLPFLALSSLWVATFKTQHRVALCQRARVQVPSTPTNQQSLSTEEEVVDATTTTTHGRDSEECFCSIGKGKCFVAVKFDCTVFPKKKKKKQKEIPSIIQWMCVTIGGTTTTSRVSVRFVHCECVVWLFESEVQWFSTWIPLKENCGHWNKGVITARI